MFIRKYRLLIVVTFLCIFSAKMVISVAPVFFSDVDKYMMNSVIMQLELGHDSDGDSGKASLKYIDYKFNFHHHLLYEPILYHFSIKNSFIDHFKRYVDPYHPSVPTPPPNISLFVMA